MTDKQLQVIQEPTQLVALNNMKKAHNLTLSFYNELMTEGEDYGVIPGTSNKSLYQPGAEKLARLFKFSIEKELVKEVVDFDKGFFYYKYKTTIKNTEGIIITQSERSCNSFENKYRYHWVWDKYATKEQKDQAVGFNNGKHKVPKSPTELAEDINTFEAMAQKRSYVAAIREATMATTIFSAKEVDVEELESEERRKLYARYFACCADRGFTAEGAKVALKRKYEVESFKDLTDQEIEDGITVMETTYEKVGKGNKPKPINGSSGTKSATDDKSNISERVEQETNQPDDGNVDKSYDYEAEEITEMIECKTCGKEIELENAHLKKFCNVKCSKNYWTQSKK